MTTNIHNNHTTTTASSSTTNNTADNSSANAKNATIEKFEKELKSAKDELQILKEAKPLSATCTEIAEFSEREEEPFSSEHGEPNSWHKSDKGGCIII
jgi:hypothetical protein